MDTLDVKSRMEYLCEYLTKANHAYYVLDAPIMDDYQFDMLLDELAKLEKENLQWRSPYSPTLRVGGEALKSFTQSTHIRPMLSLANTYSEQEIREFVARAEKILDSKFQFVCELKYDGVSIALHYDKGCFIKALTRGDGIQGDDVSNNIKTIASIPLKLPKGDYPDSFEIRGEVLMPHKVFESLNQEKLEQGDSAFANPRNAASGSLKLLDPKAVAKRKLDCYLYYLLSDEIPENRHSERLKLASDWGFKTGNYSRKCSSIEEILDYISYWDRAREDLDFDIDGVVIKIDQMDLWQELGNTSKSPRWAIAYKFKAERQSSLLESISWQLGRTGNLTPVANLVPVHLGGSLISRASLHNAEIIKSLDIREGDYVFVEKGGEVIPKIVGVDLQRRRANTMPYQAPDYCPECGTLLVRNPQEVDFYCPNEDGCPAQIKARLEHFISKQAMNIESLGEGKIEVLFRENRVKDLSDFYRLDYQSLYGLGGKQSEDIISGTTSKEASFQQKTVQNILNAIENSKNVPFERVLFALGIRYVGKTTAKLLAQYFLSIEEMAKAEKLRLLEVEGVGQKVADSLINYFGNPKNQETIAFLKEQGLQFSIDESQIPKQKGEQLVGSWVVSGSFSIPRDEIKALIEAHGGKLTSGISSKTDYVLAGEKMGPEKLKKAENLGIRLLSEAAFWEILKA